MSLTLDPATEQRIQRETALRHLEEPAQLINRALDSLIQEESRSPDLTEEEKAALNHQLDSGLAEIKAGGGIPEDQVRAALNARMSARLAARI